MDAVIVIPVSCEAIRFLQPRVYSAAEIRGRVYRVYTNTSDSSMKAWCRKFVDDRKDVND